MKSSGVLSMAALAFVLFGVQQAEAVNCNALDSGRCVIARNYDNSSSSMVCTDAPTSTSCTTVCGYNTPYGGCGMWFTRYHASCGHPMQIGTSCSSRITEDGRVEDPEMIEVTTCGATAGYCGWRDGSNKSPSAGVAHAARAKLHSCAANGYNDESNYDTLVECTSGNPHTKNNYCADSVWDTLCNEWL